MPHLLNINFIGETATKELEIYFIIQGHELCMGQQIIVQFSVCCHAIHSDTGQMKQNEIK